MKSFCSNLLFLVFKLEPVGLRGAYIRYLDYYKEKLNNKLYVL